jgi:hypothetical protein
MNLTQRRKGAERTEEDQEVAVIYAFFAPLRLCVRIFGICALSREGAA